MADIQTNRQVISDVVGAVRANNITDRISYRLVLSILRDKVKNFLRQDADNRRLFKQANLWQTIPCVSMEKIPEIVCNVMIPESNHLMRSVIRIPETYATMYGQVIRVLNISTTNSIEYKQIQQEDYKDLITRKYRDRRVRYFWIDDNYIFIPDSDVEQIKIIGYFKKPEDVSRVLDKNNGCKKPFDEEFKCPDYLIEVVKDSAYKTIMGTFKSSRVASDPTLDERQIPVPDHK